MKWHNHDWFQFQGGVRCSSYNRMSTGGFELSGSDGFRHENIVSLSVVFWPSLSLFFVSASCFTHQLWLRKVTVVPFEPCHDKTIFMLYANNKDADHPAHAHSLISAFVVRCLGHP